MQKERASAIRMYISIDVIFQTLKTVSDHISNGREGNLK